MNKITRRVLLVVLAVVMLAALAVTASAQNPYMDLWEHVPDGEPYVFGDRVYVYGSHDVFETRMCGPNYVVWSAPVDDLTNWKYEGISFDGGKSGYLLAPDVCQGPDGKYYQYAMGDCDQGGKGSTFVAVSDKPEGPFEYVGPIMVNGKAIMLFDPACFMDDDGRVWLFGGASNIYELDPKDMRTAIAGPFQVQEMDAKGNLTQIRYFQEGSSMRKIGDWYVFVYAGKHPIDTGDWYTNNKNNKDYCNGTLEYAYSKSITGPYTYGGVIVFNGGDTINPSPNTLEKTYYNGNTHGSICQIKDQWFVFYHRQTTDKQTYRQAMADPIELTVTDEGVFIKQAEMTSSGLEVNGLKAEKEYSAGIACYLTRGAYVNTDVEMYDTLTPVVNIKNSAIVGFKYINFEGKNYDLSMEVKAMGIPGKVAVRLDDPDSAPVAMLDVTGEETTVLTAHVGEITGKHAVYFTFYAVSQDVICEFNSFEFVEAVADLAITTQPETFAGKVGETASFTLAANRDDVTYQWYYSNNGWSWSKSSMAGCTTDTLSVEMKAFRVGQQYKCVITDADGCTVTSEIVELTVASSAAKIVENPSDVTVAVKETAVFTVKAEGEGLTYQWMYSNNGGASWSKSTAPGAATAALSIEAKAFRNGQMYKCIVCDAQGNAVESTAAAIVIAK